MTYKIKKINFPSSLRFDGDETGYTYRNPVACPRRRPPRPWSWIFQGTCPHKSRHRNWPGILVAKRIGTCSAPAQLTGSAYRRIAPSGSSPARLGTLVHVRVFFATIPPTWRMWVSTVVREPAICYFYTNCFLDLNDNKHFDNRSLYVFLLNVLLLIYLVFKNNFCNWIYYIYHC